MSLPFTRVDLLELFARYNREIWPLQILTIALAGLAVGTALAPRRAGHGDRLIALVLASLWAVSGVGFHLLYFTSVTPAAHVFGWAFVAGAATIAWAGVVRRAIVFAPPHGWPGVFGALFVAYAVIAYPVIGAAAGHVYPAAPILGVAPCPTTILTVGLLLWAKPPIPWVVFVLPFAWSVVGLGAAVELDVFEDLGLLASAIGCVAGVAARHVERDAFEHRRARTV
jgi:hypothetical protein